jgi:hypothetical protein
MDVTGRVLMNKKLNTEATIRVEGLSQGVYILETEKGLIRVVKTK